MNKINAFHMIIIFCLLSLLDYISTLLVLSKDGIELNPIAAIAFMSGRPALYGLLYKAFTILLVLSIYTFFKRKAKLHSIKRILIVVNIILLLAVINNFWWGVVGL